MSAIATAGGHSSQRRAVAAGVVGNVLEWYDFAVYGFFAPILAQLFFPASDPVVSLIGAFSAFAAGYLMRPIGGMLFGHIADKLGRKRALMFSIGAMAAPTVLMGLLPTYEQWGVTATVLIVLLRMVQGLSVGGEYTSSIVYLVEQAPERRRCFVASWSFCGGIGGILLGSAVGALLELSLDEAQLASWGWRAAFLFGFVAAIGGVLIRRHLPAEAPVVRGDAQGSAARLPIVVVLNRHWRAVLHTVGLYFSLAVSFYLVFLYVVTWLVERVQKLHATALEINTFCMAVLLLCIPLGGHLADRFGRRRMLLVGFAGLAVCAYPLLMLMHHPHATLIVIGQCGFAVLVALSCGALATVGADLFPPDVRVTGLGLGYNIANAVFGGTAPLVALWLIERTGDDLAFAWYLIGAALISLVSALLLKPARS